MMASAVTGRTNNMAHTHLIIGAGGAIGRAVTEALAAREPQSRVFAVARQHQQSFEAGNVTAITLESANEEAVNQWTAEQKASGIVFSTVICTAGVLHGDAGGTAVSPEKKIEDISADKLLAYFSVNTVVPAIWLKALVNVLDKERSTIACLSARVGSISDNRLGGWYGYRASKAALNMMLKTAAAEFSRRSKNTVLISYHPGTVDSALSEPFQGNVPEGKLFTPAFTASQLLDFIDKATPENNPHFTDWAHKPVPW